MSHTPGPWEARNYSTVDRPTWYITPVAHSQRPIGWSVVPDAMAETIVTVYEHSTQSGGVGRANATLIAAAPDLLAAALAVMEYAESCDLYPDEGGAFDMLSAVIAKARGES